MSAPSRGQGLLAVLAAMIHTRMELASLDFEAHVEATLEAALLAIVSVVLALIAFAFLGVAVIAIFWETHRVIATLATTGAYVLLAAGLMTAAHSRWRQRPRPLEATLQQLRLDRDAIRRQL